MRIALCDDNQDFLQNTVNLIRQWAAESGITAELFPFDNGDALLSKITGTHMDIVFLDILMPLQNGIDIGRELRQHDNVVQLIYLTSSPEFALESYETKAQGYLLKPVSYEKLKETLDECSHTCTIQQKNMVLKTAQGYQRVYFHDIEFAEAQNKKVLFICGQDRSSRPSLHFMLWKISFWKKMAFSNVTAVILSTFLT